MKSNVRAGDATLEQSRPRVLNAHIARAVAAVLATTVGAAYAADNAPAAAGSEQLEEIVVSGIRYATQQAISMKRAEDGIVEVVTAEDIGKLPDPSVAESIARLPGISGQRIGGRIQDISVRGFGGDYTTTTLNGREQASTGDNRAVQFDQYPGEVVDAVMVYKTTDADRAAVSGLAGTVDIRTMRPLSHESRVLALGLRGERNSLGNLMSQGKDSGYRFNATWIEKFADNTLGIGLAYARLSSPEQEQHEKSWWFGADGPTVTNPNAINNGSNALALDGVELYNYSRLDVRDGLVGTIEWQPNDTIHSVTDVYYSRYSQNAYDAGWETFLCPCVNGQPLINYTLEDIGVIPAGGNGSGGPSVVEFVNKGTYQNLQPIVINEFTGTHDRLYAIGENFEYTANGWKSSADLSYSYAHRESSFLQEYAGYGPMLSNAGGNVTVDNALAGLPTVTSSLNYSDASKIYLGDPAPWGGWGHDGTGHNQDSTDKISAVRLQTVHEMSGWLSKVTFGLNYQHRTKDRVELDYNLCLPGNLVDGSSATYSCQNLAPITIPSSVLLPSTNLFGGFGPIVTWDTRGAGQSVFTSTPINNQDQYALNYSVKEKLTTAFTQLDFKGHLGDTPMHGNLGLALVHTQQSSFGLSINNQDSSHLVLVPSNQGASYNDFLPTLNLIFDLSDTVKLRAYAGRQIARPEMQDMANYTEASPTQIVVGPNAGKYEWSGSGGNPTLRPWRANAFDVSVEKYVSAGTYFAVAGFYKKLLNFIDSNIGQTKDFAAAGFTDPTKVFVSGLGSWSAPQNYSSGVVKGLEFSASIDIGHFYEPLRGLGTQFSEAWTSSTIPPDPGTGPTLPGLSPKVRTITGFYERNGFSVRLSERYRDQFEGTVLNVFGFRGYTEIMDDRQLDGSIGYSFKEGPLKGLDILLQGLNLRDNAYRDTVGLFNSATGLPFQTTFLTPQTYERYGRTYLLGVTYKF